jgi:HK97 gp10 family phage protein
MIETNIQGLAEIDRILKELPENIARRELAGALRAGAATIQKEAKLRAPDSNKQHSKYGDLRNNIRVRRIRASNSVGALAVAVTTGRAFWAKFVEFGRAAVKIKKKKVLTGDGITFYGTEVAAAPARPFMRPAFDAAGPRAIEAIAKRLKAGVLRQAKRFSLKG